MTLYLFPWFCIIDSIQSLFAGSDGNGGGLYRRCKARRPYKRYRDPDPAVNYFEFVNALDELQEQQLIESTENGFVITEKGSVVADTLSDDLPRSVRESAVRAVIRIQSWVHKAAQNKARVEHDGDEYRVICTIEDMGRDSFQVQLSMPDQLTAEMVKNRFIAKGSEVYSQLLNLLTQPFPEDAPPEAVL